MKLYIYTGIPLKKYIREKNHDKLSNKKIKQIKNV